MYGEASASLRRWSRCLWAAKASALRRRASSPFVFMLAKAVEDEQRRAHGNRRVRYVERRPVPAGRMEIEKVDHLAEAETIGQVAERAAQDESEPRAKHRALRRSHQHHTHDD